MKAALNDCGQMDICDMVIFFISLVRLITIIFALRAYFLGITFLICKFWIKDVKATNGILLSVVEALFPISKLVLLLMIAIAMTLANYYVHHNSNFYLVFLFVAIPASLLFMMTIFSKSWKGKNQVLRKIQKIFKIKRR